MVYGGRADQRLSRSRPFLNAPRVFALATNAPVLLVSWVEHRCCLVRCNIILRRTTVPPVQIRGAQDCRRSPA